jgi:hypothetical protein
MRYVLMNWVHPDDAAAWEEWSAEDKQADIDRHMAWFGKHREHIAGGEELDEVRTVKTLRPGRQGRASSSPTVPSWKPRRSSAAS